MLKLLRRPRTDARHHGSRPVVFPLLGTAALLAAVLLSGCDRSNHDEQATEPSPRPVRVVEARLLEQPERLRLPGALRARARAELTFLHPGYLAERHVQLGQQVAAGTLLATLHNPTLQPGVASAQAQVNEARTRLEQLEIDTRRQATLVERRLISEDQLDQTRTRRDAARAALEQAEAALSEARGQLAEASLRAPFDGRIARFIAEPGDFVAAGQTVMSISAEQALETEVSLPSETDLARVTDVRILRIEDGRNTPGEITGQGQASPGRPRQVIVTPAGRVGENWTPGDAVHVEFELSSRPRVAVPLAALIDPGTGITRLFRVQDGRAERVSVQAGRLSGGWVTVFGDIEPGDRIITAGQALLLDGEAIQVIE